MEYNPFHHGHIYHIEAARKTTHADVLIAVMSPHFVQRGAPSLIHKWVRTEAALEHGVDLVLELPTCFALQAADIFAAKAVQILALAGVTDLVFGSESNRLETLEQPVINKDLLEKGASYAKAMETVQGPNDILATQYIKACKNHSIIPHAIQRTNQYHDLEATNDIASATAIRHALKTGQPTHTMTPLDLHALELHTLHDMEAWVHYALAVSDTQSLRSMLLVDEGIENLLRKHQHLPLETLIETCVSKRYTRSRIQRTLMNIVLGLRKNEVKNPTQFRVLGMNDTGQRYLRHLKNDAVSFTTSFKHYEFKDLEYKATRIYGLSKPYAYRQWLLQRETEGPVVVKATKP